MKNHLIIIFIFAFFGCTKEKYPDNVEFDERPNSLSEGLFSINNDYLWINAYNQVITFDFNGNQKKILMTYPRSSYQIFRVRDSFLSLFGEAGLIYHISNKDKLVPFTNPAGSYSDFRPFQCVTVDSGLLVLNKIKLYDIYNKLNLYQVKNSKLIDIPLINNMEIKANAFCVLNDSLLYVVNNRFQLINLNDKERKLIDLPYTYSTSTWCTSMLADKNQLIFTNGGGIQFFEYKNKELLLKSELR